MPLPLPTARCALTAPFHPYPHDRNRVGGLLSVALSLGSPPPGVTRHRVPMEPGLSSLKRYLKAVIRPSGDYNVKSLKRRLQGGQRSLYHKFHRLGEVYIGAETLLGLALTYPRYTLFVLKELLALNHYYFL